MRRVWGSRNHASGPRGVACRTRRETEEPGVVLASGPVNWLQIQPATSLEGWLTEMHHLTGIPYAPRDKDLDERAGGSRAFTTGKCKKNPAGGMRSGVKFPRGADDDVSRRHVAYWTTPLLRAYCSGVKLPRQRRVCRAIVPGCRFHWRDRPGGPCLGTAQKH